MPELVEDSNSTLPPPPCAIPQSWSNTYKLKTSSTGKASKAFKVPSKRVRYYRWYVPAKSGVCLKTYSKITKVTVK